MYRNVTPSPGTSMQCIFHIACVMYSTIAPRGAPKKSQQYTMELCTMVFSAKNVPTKSAITLALEFVLQRTLFYFLYISVVWCNLRIAFCMTVVFLNQRLHDVQCCLSAIMQCTHNQSPRGCLMPFAHCLLAIQGVVSLS